MWISRKKWKCLEKRIADLEMKIQSQQDEINLQESRYEALPLSEIIEDVLQSSGENQYPAIQWNLNRSRLFEQIIVPKQ